jgi:hypothetical protein
MRWLCVCDPKLSTIRYRIRWLVGEAKYNKMLSQLHASTMGELGFGPGEQCFTTCVQSLFSTIHRFPWIHTGLCRRVCVSKFGHSDEHDFSSVIVEGRCLNPDGKYGVCVRSVVTEIGITHYVLRHMCCCYVLLDWCAC